MAIGNRALLHYFHADANALGAVIQEPKPENAFPVQSSVSLPPVGGQVSAVNITSFKSDSLVSVTTSRSEVHGHFEAGYPTTNAASKVERLSVLAGRVQAEQIVGQITLGQPWKGEGDFPKVSFREPKFRSSPGLKFGDTTIDGLQIDNERIEVVLDLNLLGTEEEQKCLKRPHLKDEKLWEKVCRQYDDKAGVLVCTLVKDIKGADGTGVKRVGRNGLQVENLGRIFFAELLVQYHSYRLIMMRFELGCTTQGDLSTVMVAANGHSGGP
jgi:hypothetical protein